ncbi:hypothetical protein DLAC_03708 [Tieghemostelium lacteum]|uniref:Uncharacterized protein n=1 Tax=Tieghemostelium lacteum TaxID=361077 RepID=A0A152A0N4_TIELA|nr:hypothetical protein DLAC_03708 [Tieghemostelium lacteum]|eukprot:KYQ99763.1 hypothetical protein DLAC_03708 [Tieghemostelium lacteum]
MSKSNKVNISTNSSTSSRDNVDNSVKKTFDDKLETTSGDDDLDKILSIIKECNYTLVNSITNTEEIQKEKEEVEDLVNNQVFNDEKRLKKLQYNVSFETENLMKTLMKLDSLIIVGHIKHSHKLKKERRKQKKTDFTYNNETEDISSNSSYTSNTSSFSSASSGSSGSSGEDVSPKFGPHKLRKYKKRLVNRIIRLVDYLDTLSADIKEIKLKYEKQVELNQKNDDDFNKSIPIMDGNNKHAGFRSQTVQKNPQPQQSQRNTYPYNHKTGKKSSPKTKSNNNNNLNRDIGNLNFLDDSNQFEYDDPNEYSDYSNYDNYTPTESPMERLNRYNTQQRPQQPNHYRHFQHNPFGRF